MCTSTRALTRKPFFYRLSVCRAGKGGFLIFFVDASHVPVYVCARQENKNKRMKANHGKNVVKIGAERSRSGSEGLRFCRDNYRDVRDSVSFPA